MFDTERKLPYKLRVQLILRQGSFGGTVKKSQCPLKDTLPGLGCLNSLILWVYEGRHEFCLLISFLTLYDRLGLSLTVKDNQRSRLCDLISPKVDIHGTRAKLSMNQDYLNQEKSRVPRKGLCIGLIPHGCGNGSATRNILRMCTWRHGIMKVVDIRAASCSLHV